MPLPSEPLSASGMILSALSRILEVRCVMSRISSGGTVPVRTNESIWALLLRRFLQLLRRGVTVSATFLRLIFLLVCEWVNTCRVPPDAHYTTGWQYFPSASLSYRPDRRSPHDTSAQMSGRNKHVHRAQSGSGRRCTEHHGDVM